MNAITPLHLQILTQSYAYASPVSNWHSPAAQNFAAEMVAQGLLTVEEFGDTSEGPAPMRWSTTARGKAWLDMILATPLPEQRWIDPRFEAAA